MKVQLDALFRRRVHPHGRLQLHNGVRLHDHLVIVPVKGHFTLNFHPHTGADAGEDWLCLVIFHELIDADGACIVRHVEAHDPRVALFELLVVDGEDLARHDHAVHIQVQILHLHDLAAERAAKDHVSGGRLRGRRRGRFLCRFFDLHGGSLRHGLAADSGRLVEKRPAF